MNDADWVLHHISAGPARLRTRVLECWEAAPSAAPLAERLAEAGRRALAGVVAHPGDREAALDLLAADALITLALLARAEAEPEELGEFAAALVRASAA
ncbi:MAG TPA: hypothetical protein VFO06_08545 [Gemmatimonadales bacterium]|nr:hypothetical protein [Gemmatimonadales bacterium]